MKVIILAGGWGTRLGQLTDSIPKPMVKIGNKPILWHIMKIYSHYGYNDFIIALGVKGEVIKDYFYNYEFLNNDFTVDLSTGDIVYHNNHDETGWKVTLVDTGQETLKGARIKRVEKYLDDDTNMVTYGDGIADIDIRKLVDFHKSHDKIITITGVHPPARFGELGVSKGIVNSFIEKSNSSKNEINGGYMVFNRELLDHLTIDKNCDFEFDTLENLSKLGQVMMFKHNGQWECMDHERDVIYMNKLLVDNKAFWKVW